jgi:hypothetical protein
MTALLLVCVPSQATLGEDEGSAETDRMHLNAHRTMRSRAGYTMQEMLLPSGTTVHEYVAPSGKVFAVTWRGPALPDLEQILGGHFQTFMSAPDALQIPRRVRSLQRDELVVHSAGHQRAFSGYAYIPALLPPGVAAEDLR